MATSLMMRKRPATVDDIAQEDKENYPPEKTMRESSNEQISTSSADQMMAYLLREQDIRKNDQDIRRQELEIRAREVEQRGEQFALIRDMAMNNRPSERTINSMEDAFRGFETQFPQITHEKK